MSTEGVGTTGTSPTKTTKKNDDYCLIIPLPKIVFFYPTMLVSLLCWFCTASVEEDIIGKTLFEGHYSGEKVQKALGEDGGGEKPDWGRKKTRNIWNGVASEVGILDSETGATPTNWPGWAFLVVFTLNILVVAFDFPGVKALATAFFVFGVSVLILYLNVLYNIIEPLSDFIKQVSPFASTDFYLFIVFLLAIVIGISMFVNRFWNKWTLTPISLIHKHGMLGNVREFRTINLQVHKEIPDIFEFLLLGAGSLVFKLPGEPEPIRLENVMWISLKEIKIKRLLSEAFMGD